MGDKRGETCEWRGASIMLQGQGEGSMKRNAKRRRGGEEEMEGVEGKKVEGESGEEEEEEVRRRAWTGWGQSSAE